MGDAPQAVPQTDIGENAFWANFMPAGKQAAAANSEQTAANERMDVDPARTKDDNAAAEDSEFDGRGGKWAKEQTGRGKGRNSGGGGGTAAGDDKQRKDQKWTSWNQSWGSRDAGRDSDRQTIQDLRRQVGALQRPALRHEDAINTLRADCSFVCFLRTHVDASVVGPLSQARSAWAAQKERSPESLTKPTRTVLFQCLVSELLARTVGLQEESINHLARVGWFNKETQSWHYLRWSQSEKKLEVDSKPPVPRQLAQDVIQDVVKLSAEEGAIARFYPTRPLQPDLKGEALALLLQFPTRGETADKLISHMNLLCGLAVTQLCACQFRPERGQRSGLAVAISKEMAS